MSDKELPTPPLEALLHWAKDRRPGEHGFTWAMHALLRQEAGNYAVLVGREKNAVFKKALQAREVTYDALADLIYPFLPPMICDACGVGVTNDGSCQCTQ